MTPVLFLGTDFYPLFASRRGFRSIAGFHGKRLRDKDMGASCAEIASSFFNY
jgi:hypothetical protein